MAITTVASSPIDTLATQTSQAAAASQASTATAGMTDAGSSDRFLKLLVSQLKNQDPLNPMDNAQVTSQMAQISTVSGIQQLNSTVAGLNSQFGQLQALQGAALVGHDITLVGNKLDVAADSAVGVGGFELVSPADSVKVDIIDSKGKLQETLNLGAQPKGMNGFEWSSAKAGETYTFKIAATANGTAMSPVSLMRDHVNAVALVNNKLVLETARSGAVDYTTIKAVN